MEEENKVEDTEVVVEGPTEDTSEEVVPEETVAPEEGDVVPAE